MARIESIERPAAAACTCGDVMQSAMRYEATRTLPVLVCWSCGSEDPPYRQRVVDDAFRRACSWCGDRFRTTNRRRLTCSADCEQRRLNAHEAAVAKGHRIRRRAS